MWLFLSVSASAAALMSLLKLREFGLMVTRLLLLVVSLALLLGWRDSLW